MSRFHPENEPARCDCHLKDKHPIIGCQRVPGTNANAHASSCPRYLKFNLHPTALALEAAKFSGRYFRPREVCPVCKTSVALKHAAVRGLEFKYHERKGEACDGSYMKAKTTVEQAYAAVRA